jgi:hypothetical protein
MRRLKMQTLVLAPKIAPAAPIDTLTKLVMLRDGIDSVLADRPSKTAEDNLYWSRHLIVAAIREEASRLPRLEA